MPIQWKDVQKWLGDTTSTAVKESRELARKGKVQLDIMGLRHETTKSLAELGSVVYQLVHKEKSGAIAQDAKVKSLIEKLHELELQLKRKEKERKTRKPS